MECDIGAQAICDAQVIPLLVNFLDHSPVPLACRSASILSMMTHHRDSCVAMLHAGALTPLIRLLSQEIGEEDLRVIAHTITKCIPHDSGESDLHVPDIPRDALQQLVSLLGPGRTEVRLAAAEAIHAVASLGVTDVTEALRGPGEVTVLYLCHLALDCQDLAKKEVVISAISALWNQKPFNASVDEIIDTKILPLLIHLLGDSNAQMVIGACRALRKLRQLDNSRGVLPHLAPLLSHSDDEVFVEGVWTMWALTLHHLDSHGPHEFFDLATTQRLRRLLHHDKEQIVVSVLRSIGDASALGTPAVGVLDERSISQIVNLVSSRNIDAADAALHIVATLASSASDCETARGFVEHGAIQMLGSNLAIDAHPLLKQTLDTLACLVLDEQGFEAVAPHLVRLMASSDILKGKAVDILHGFFTLNVDHSVAPGPLHPSTSIPVLLIQAVLHAKDSTELEKVLYVLCGFITYYSQSYEEFRRAGIGSFLADLTPLSGISLYNDRVRECLGLIDQNTS